MTMVVWVWFLSKSIGMVVVDFGGGQEGRLRDPRRRAEHVGCSFPCCQDLPLYQSPAE